MIAYKGFDKDLKCRGFQYEIGKEYETDEAVLCESGFHACEDPIDCFGYYSPGQSVYHKVEIEDNGQRNDDDTKVVGKKIKIGARLSVSEICKLHFDFVKEHTTVQKQSQDRSSLSAQNGSSLSAQDRSSLSGGNNCVIAAFNSIAKAGLGTLIALANRKWINGNYKITDFKAAIIDGEILKADTWYTLKNGEFVEV